MATSAISGRSVTGREIHPPLADSSTGPLRRDAVRPRCGSDGNRSHLFGDFAAQHRAERMRQCTRDRRHASRSINGPNRTASRTSTHLYGLRSNGPSRREVLPALRITTALEAVCEYRIEQESAEEKKDAQIRQKIDLFASPTIS